MKPLLLSLLSGLLFAFSLPPFNWEWLGWVAFVPLLAGVPGRRPLEAVGLGMLAGVACGAVQAGWYHDTARLLWAYIPFLWLCFLFGVVALAASQTPSHWNPVVRVLFVASVGVGGEWVTSFLPLPLNVALCQYRNLPLIQIADFAGIWGVSLLLWWANAALADYARHRRPAPAGVGLALILLSLGYGAWALHRPTLPAPTLTVAAIQDLTREETGDLAAPAGATDRAEMTRQAVGQGAKLVVWSEESLGGEFTPTDPKDETRALARSLHTALVVGYSDDTKPKPFNCAAYIAPTGDVLAPAHHKIHLYLAERETNRSGHDATVVQTPQGRVGLEICFDSCYTNTTRATVRRGANLIAMPNYDPPTPRGVLHRLHGAMLPFRAVENRVPFVRADSNGLSQIVSSSGQVIAQAPLFQTDILLGSVTLGTGRGTFFTRWGDWLAYGCLLVAALGLAGRLSVRREPRAPDTGLRP
jgi:apolipoprotein N-acyltransferase